MECKRAKTKRRRRAGKGFMGVDRIPPTRFGQLATIDHVSMRDWMGLGGIEGACDVLNFYDFYSECKYSCPVHGLDTWESYTHLNWIKGRNKIDHIYHDNYTSLKAAVHQLGAQSERSTPGIHHSNSIIERQNQIILYGTKVILFQAGLPACYWTYASPYFCHIESLGCRRFSVHTS